jgi:hypothetical protein
VAIAFIASIAWIMQFGRRGRALMPGGIVVLVLHDDRAHRRAPAVLSRVRDARLVPQRCRDEYKDYGAVSPARDGSRMALVIFIEMGLWGPRSVTERDSASLRLALDVRRRPRRARR